MERFAFYQESAKAFALVQTGETSPYGNIILTKGVVFEPVILNAQQQQQQQAKTNIDY